MWSKVLIRFKRKCANLEGLIMPEASLRMVSLVLLAKLSPTQPIADSAKFKAAFGRVGSALLPM